MSDLTSTASAGMNKDQAITLQEVTYYMESGTIEAYLLPIGSWGCSLQTGRYQ